MHEITFRNLTARQVAKLGALLERMQKQDGQVVTTADPGPDVPPEGPDGGGPK